MLASSNLAPDTMGHWRNRADALHSGCSFSRFESEMAHQIFAGVANRRALALNPRVCQFESDRRHQASVAELVHAAGPNSSFWEFESPRSHHGGQLDWENSYPNAIAGFIPGSPATRRKPIGQVVGRKPALASPTRTRRSMRRR